MRKIAFMFITLFLLTSCEERITYKWSEINVSLGQLQDAREELQSVISDLEYEDFDTSKLEEVDDRLRKVEKILDSNFFKI